jgi:PKD repeat protein
MGYQYEILPHPSKLLVPEMYNGGKDGYEYDTYPTYDAYIAIMEQFAADYPDICEVFSIGESEEGRELKFVKISDNVSENEAEPRFMYTGTMHGDETAGFTILLELINYLTTNYGTDAEATEMVDNIEIWINPAANPDGTYAGGNNTVFGATRNNANGVNLNRNYPDPEDGPHPDGNAWQAETEAFMALAEDYHFVMSANTHGGAEVINYPWDTWPQLAADDDWWQFVSHEFADTAQANSPSFYMNGFNDGITNGYQWYSIDGGRQDYMNYFHQCREVTMELSDVKLLPENQLENHWNYTRRAMINYLKQVMYGVHGFVTDSITGEPLEGVKVEILGHDIDESHVYTGETHGDFYRLLKAGTYDITFSREGCIPKTIEDVEVIDYETTYLDVELVCDVTLIADFDADQMNIAIGDQVQFNENCYGDVDTYEWTFEGGTPSSSNEANPLVTYNGEGSFDVSLTITSGGDSQTITKEDYITVSELYLMTDAVVETCSGLFVDNGGMDGDYSDNQDMVFTIIGGNPEDVALEIEFLEFSIEENATCDYDYLEIYNGMDETAPLIGKYCGTNSPGLVLAENEDNALTFVFHSDGSVTAPGWVAQIDCAILDNVNELSGNKVNVFPNPIHGSVLTVESDERMSQINLYNLAGQKLGAWQSDALMENINVNDFEKGIYLLEINTINGKVIEKLTIN